MGVAVARSPPSSLRSLSSSSQSSSSLVLPRPHPRATASSQECRDIASLSTAVLAVTTVTHCISLLIAAYWCYQSFWSCCLLYVYLILNLNIPVDIDIRLFIGLFVCYVCRYVRIYIYIYIYIQLFTYLCSICVCSRTIRLCVCMYIYIHTHTHVLDFLAPAAASQHPLWLECTMWCRCSCFYGSQPMCHRTTTSATLQSLCKNPTAPWSLSLSFNL